ncbi:hypothetical protein, partial [Rhodovarius sp.]|uniref:hypothetical protein n=1 Tax=Rhodovarius sp. TaxID=2972673 RepID=UPI0034A4CD14
WRGWLGASRGPNHLNGRRKGYWQAVVRSRRQLEIVVVTKPAANNERVLTSRWNASIARSTQDAFVVGMTRLSYSCGYFAGYLFLF